MPNLELQRALTAAAIESRGVDAIGGDFHSRIPHWASGNISAHDSRFLAGLANFANPRKVAEIGVASGWSSAVLLKAISGLGGDRKVIGVDLSPHYYLDPSVPTGRAVDETVPELLPNYRLLTGRLAFDAMRDVGSIDFAFIDGHHMHPWATIDMLSVLPFIERGRWIAMHDLNLCTYERHRHTNRGPFYLFYMWPDQKLHSTQVPTMVGAVVVERNLADYLPILLEILYTPWEVDIDPVDLSRLTGLIGDHFGDAWSQRFAEAFDCCRERFKTANESVVA